MDRYEGLVSEHWGVLMREFSRLNWKIKKER